MSRRLVDGKLPTKPKDADPGGRQSLLELDREVIPKIEQVLKIGTSIQTAFALQGYSYETVRNWVLKGKEDPDSLYGELIKRVEKAVAEYELRDIIAWDSHVTGKPAQYEMEVVRDEKGRIVYTQDKDGNKVPMMQVAKDGDGFPILKSPAIKPDWRAAMERISRRMPKYWARRDQLAVTVDNDDVLKATNEKAGSKEAMSFNDKVKDAMRKFDDEY